MIVSHCLHTASLPLSCFGFFTSGAGSSGGAEVDPHPPAAAVAAVTAIIVYSACQLIHRARR